MVEYVDDERDFLDDVLRYVERHRLVEYRTRRTVLYWAYLYCTCVLAVLVTFVSKRSDTTSYRSWTVRLDHGSGSLGLGSTGCGLGVERMLLVTSSVLVLYFAQYFCDKRTVCNQDRLL